MVRPMENGLRPIGHPAWLPTSRAMHCCQPFHSNPSNYSAWCIDVSGSRLALLRPQQSQRALLRKTNVASSASLSSGRENQTGKEEDVGISYGKNAHDDLGPALEKTLEVLEWRRLCSFVAGFAQTSLGRRACAALVPPVEAAASEALLEETRAVNALQADYATELEFGGIETALADEALRRARRGGMLSGAALLAVSSLMRGTAKLKKNIQIACREAESFGDEGLRLVADVVACVPENSDLASEIAFSIQEDGSVRESASEDVRKAASRLRTIEGRIMNMLKGGVGEVSEYGGRLCLAIPLSSEADPASGVLLGSGRGGGLRYVEPSAAVALNNERASVKNELVAAEEAVLWRLTKSVAIAAGDLSSMLDVVVWLDVLGAKSKYGRWIEGTLPQFVPFSRTKSNRISSKRHSGHDSSASFPSSKISDHRQMPQDTLDANSETRFVFLRDVRHPLLLGDHLVSLAEFERSRKRIGDVASSKDGRLPGWRKENTNSDKDRKSAEDDGSLRPAPVPFDIRIENGTRAVIITGPNTGGKTAALKALGLIVLAAKSGIPVPVRPPASLPSFDMVLADIGDEQSLSANLSTFSGHLRRIEDLRKESTGKSLVLLDELGTGTDPEEGAALSIALLHKLVKGGAGGAALAVATTHHSSLTLLKYGKDGGIDFLRSFEETAWHDDWSDGRIPGDNGGPMYENASVEFDEARLMPTYKLLWGIPGRSNALNIAERLGLDEAIVASARERLGKAAKRVDEAIVELEGLRRSVDEDDAAFTRAEERLALLREEHDAIR